jgi:aspartyl-tRNA synthetase
MAFATEEDVFKVGETVLYNTFKAFTKKEVTEIPFPVIPYKEAMLKYGTDKPDLRNPLVIFDLTDFFKRASFEPFKINPVRAILVPKAGEKSKSFFKNMEKYAFEIGMKGLGYITMQEDGTYKGPIDKFLTDEQKKELKEITETCAEKNFETNSVLYFISAPEKQVANFAGQIRTEVAKRMDIIDKNKFAFCYINDFPMYEEDEETGKIKFTHNPFSMPNGEMDALMNKDPLDILALQYDIVCNGIELSSGAVRNHSPEIMEKAFAIAGYSKEVLQEKFDALYEAFQYGAPPHAGMAPGIDRIVMLLTEEENIREVIPFPLASNGTSPMMNYPGYVSELQLREAHIKIRE